MVRSMLMVTLLLLFISGCAHQEPTPTIKYITKVEYLYIPYQKQHLTSKSKSVTAVKPTYKRVASKKRSSSTRVKYRAPKEREIFSPKKYVKRANKKMDFMIGIAADGSEFVYLEGEFGVNTYKNFLKFVTQSHTMAKVIKINSNGGLVATAMQIGAYVHEQGWTTGVDREMQCLSACGFVYFAGKQKRLEGQAVVGLHRPYLPGVKDTSESIRQTKRNYLSYWNYIQAPKSVYDEMMDVGRDELYILNKHNINEYIDVTLY